MLERTNLIAAILAAVYFFTCILIFAFRLLGKPQISHATGWFQFLAFIPLIYLLTTVKSLNRNGLYILQACLMLAFLVLEFLLDYYPTVNFRQETWMVITYVVFFFAATGGLLGMAAQAGRTWSTIDGILFLVMAALAFIQRRLTGL